MHILRLVVWYDQIASQLLERFILQPVTMTGATAGSKGCTMKLARKLRKYLDRDNLTVDFDGPRVTILDLEGKEVCSGATVHTAVRKAILLNVCPCTESFVGRRNSPRKSRANQNLDLLWLQALTDHQNE